MIPIPEAPAAVLGAVVVAALLELALYFLQPKSRWPAWLLVFSSPVPYLCYSVPAGVFEWRTLLIVPLGAAAVLLWFQVLPRSRWADAAFLALMAAPILMKVPALLYARPSEDIRLEVLGQLMWIRMGITAVLRYRPQEGVGFGFWPTREEWRKGTLFFLTFLPVFAAAIAAGFTSFRDIGQPWWLIAASAAATFFGILWVVALSEEFFFRGLLQQWLDRWLRSPLAGLLLTSILFGAVHLGFRGFPNWQFASLAAAAGVVYGLAFRQGAGIRTAMVTHALVVTTWRTLFR